MSLTELRQTRAKLDRCREATGAPKPQRYEDLNVRVTTHLRRDLWQRVLALREDGTVASATSFFNEAVRNHLTLLGDLPTNVAPTSRPPNS